MELSLFFAFSLLLFLRENRKTCYYLAFLYPFISQRTKERKGFLSPRLLEEEGIHLKETYYLALYQPSAFLFFFFLLYSCTFSSFSFFFSHDKRRFSRYVVCVNILVLATSINKLSSQRQNGDSMRRTWRSGDACSSNSKCSKNNRQLPPGKPTTYWATRTSIYLLLSSFLLLLPHSKWKGCYLSLCLYSIYLSVFNLSIYLRLLSVCDVFMCLLSGVCIGWLLSEGGGIY